MPETLEKALKVSTKAAQAEIEREKHKEIDSPLECSEFEDSLTAIKEVEQDGTVIIIVITLIMTMAGPHVTQVDSRPRPLV